MLSRGGAVAANTWVEFDVTAAVTGDGSYSFGLSNGTSDGAYYNSREATANRPQLVVTSGTTPPPSDSAVLVGAGDIADCAALTGAQKTADLISGISGTVFADGDNAYPNGTPSDYTDCYGPTWGAFKSRTKPALGNHEYYSSSTAAGYFGYFGSVAGQPSRGYYSYDLGSWHIVVLNSNCSKIEGGNDCASTSPQVQWLRSDLAGHAAQCTLAYWHHPRFSSGSTTSSSAYDPFWRALYDYGAEVVINGHAHIYERFAPQSPAAAADPRGIREFIVGTGGASLSGISTVRANSEVRDNSSFGVLKLTLGSGTYSWQFIPAAGYSFRDSGSGSCH